MADVNGAARFTSNERVAAHGAERFAAFARDCAAAGIERRCLILRLSQLPAALARPHHLRLACEALDPLMSADRATLFHLPNHDVAVLWRGAAAASLASAQTAIGHLFAECPPDLIDPASISVLLDLPTDLPRALELAEASVHAVQPPHPASRRRAKPMDVEALVRLEATLARADMAGFVRRTQIWSATPDGMLAGWENRSISLDDLSAALVPSHQIDSDPWLFARLTRTLDRRMLASLADPRELRSAGPFGLELNVASILAPEFLRFDTALPHHLRSNIRLGLLPGDILADLSAFMFARDFARARGYLLLLRLGTVDLLSVMPAEQLGVQFLQLDWSSALLRLDKAALQDMAHLIVLTGTDTTEALAWGRAQGIRLFSGRALASGGPRRNHSDTIVKWPPRAAIAVANSAG